MLDVVRRLWGAAKKFVPHEFVPKVELVEGLPRVLVSREAYEDMFLLVEESHQEVGWLGTVRRMGRDFLIEEVFLFDQEVTAATCEITPDGLASMAQELIESRPDGMDVVNRLCFWGHSHVNMGTSPSGQDETQLRELASNAGEFFIRGILNKGGRMEFTVALISLGIVVRDAGWELYEPADEIRRARWQREIAAKVREKKIALPAVAAFGLGSPVSRTVFSGGPQDAGFGRKSWKKGGHRHGRGEG